MTDILDRATDELRQSLRPEAYPASDTRDRVLLSLRHQSRRSQRLQRSILVAALLLVSSVVWASASGHLQAALREMGVEIGAADRFEHNSKPGKAQPVLRRAVQADAIPSSGPESNETEAARVGPEVDEAAEVVIAQPGTPIPDRPQKPAASQRHKESARTEASADGESGERLLYERAHRAHFVDRDPERAASLWREYLALPAPTLEPEARYNLAIALIRLQRWDEARSELQPFANGRYGGYRSERARQLLERITDR
jgi:hypothetical protein